MVQSPVGEGGGLAPVRTRARGQILPPPVKVRLIRSFRVADPRHGVFLLLKPGWGQNPDPGSGIRNKHIPDHSLAGILS